MIELQFGTIPKAELPEIHKISVFNWRQIIVILKINPKIILSTLIMLNLWVDAEIKKMKAKFKWKQGCQIFFLVFLIFFLYLSDLGGYFSRFVTKTPKIQKIPHQSLGFSVQSVGEFSIFIFSLLLRSRRKEYRIFKNQILAVICE